MRSILTTWSAMAAMGICPFFCMAEAPGDHSGMDESSRPTCKHCCHSDAPPHGEDDAPQTPCCEADCLCKGALPVKPPVEPPPPMAIDALPAGSLATALDGAPGAAWNSPRTTPYADAGGRAVRIALCSFLC